MVKKFPDAENDKFESVLSVTFFRSWVAIFVTASDKVMFPWLKSNKPM